MHVTFHSRKKYVQAPLWFDNILLSTTKFESKYIGLLIRALLKMEPMGLILKVDLFSFAKHKYDPFL
jgi:hypothetical protein